MIDKQDALEEELISNDNEMLIPDLCQGEGLFSVVIIAELMALLITVAASGIGQFDWQLLAQASLVGLWIALLSALGMCLGRDWLSSQEFRIAALYCFLMIAVITLVCGAISELAMSYFQAGNFWREFSLWEVLDYLVLTAIPSGILLRYLFLQQQLRVRQKAELDARIQALQSRIRPHFLFNSMNVIASLITTDPEKAEQAVEDISDLFRSALTDSRVMVPLSSELSLCRRYLALEKLRLGDRLETRWEIGDYGSHVRLPSLTLQPLMENAIYHGIQLLPEGGEVSVSVSCQGEQLEIVITNPLIRVLQQRKGHHIALHNVRQRLEACFDGDAFVEAGPEGTEFKTRIVLPAEGD